MPQPASSFHLSDFENLQEDLVLLQTSLEQSRVDPLRAQVQCADILSAVAEVSEEQQLVAYATFVRRLTDFVHDVKQPQATLGPEFWSLTLDVLDELLAALEMADAGLKIDTKAMHRHIAAFETRLHTLTEFSAAEELNVPSLIPETGAAESAARASNGKTAASAPALVSPPEPPAAAAPEKATSPAQQDKPAQPEAPAIDAGADPQDLLERAAAAARAGRAKEAQVLAAAAANALAIQARQQKEAELAELRARLLKIEQEAGGVTDTLAQAEAEIDRWRGDAGEAREVHREMLATAESRAQNLSEIKQQLEDVEQRMTQLQAQQGELMQRFEQAMPAKDEADRAAQQAQTDVQAKETGVREAESAKTELEERTATFTKQQRALQDNITAVEEELGS